MRFGLVGWELLAVQLLGLLGLPILGAALILVRRARLTRLRRQVAEPVLSRLTGSVNLRRRRWKWLLLMTGLGAVIFALARPQWGATSELLELRGTDVVVAVDVSLSMNARDLPPSRLAKARREVIALLDLLEGDRVGLVAFAGSAFVQCPLTSDHAALRLFLDSLVPGIILDQGTNLGAALEVATRVFDEEAASEKLVLLVTDGEETVGDPLEAARTAAAAGVRVYAIGLGSVAGEPIPVADAAGDGGYKRDREGQVVVSRLDEETLRAVAEATGGRYYRATALEREVQEIAAAVAGAEDRDLEGRLHTRFAERYQPFLLVGLILLAVEAILTDRRRSRGGSS